MRRLKDTADSLLREEAFYARLDKLGEALAPVLGELFEAFDNPLYRKLDHPVFWFKEQP